jgi:hypothetical protein
VKAVKRTLGSWKFVPPSDINLPTSEQSVFVLKPLTQLQRMEVWDNLKWVNQDGTMQPRGFQQARELCLKNIESIVNFPVGDPQPWPESIADRATYLEQVDDMDVMIIGNEIRDHSGLGEEEKN